VKIYTSWIFLQFKKIIELAVDKGTPEPSEKPKERKLT
jgi:hypothetical protein